MRKDITVGTRVRHKEGIGPDEMAVNEIGPDGTVWCVGWHGSEVKRYKFPVTALETLGESAVMKKLITLGSRVRRKGETGPEMVVVGVQRDKKLLCEWRDDRGVVRRKFAVAALENLAWDQKDEG